MAWIKFEKDLLTDPRVLRIAKALEAGWRLTHSRQVSDGVELGNDTALPAVTLVCGALIRIWSLADTHLGSDDVLPLGVDELDEVVGIPGFCELLPEDWLEPIDAESVKLPQFHEHNGTEAKKKAVTQKRVERFRNRNTSPLPTRNAQALPDQTRPDQTKEKGGRTITIEAVQAFNPNGTLRAWAEKRGYSLTWDAHLEHFKDYLQQERNRKRYTDIEAAFRTCLRADWGNLRQGAGARTVHGQAQAIKPTTCGNCGKSITGAWSQSPKGRVCDPCWKGYHKDGKWA